MRGMVPGLKSTKHNPSKTRNTLGLHSQQQPSIVGMLLMPSLQAKAKGAARPKPKEGLKRKTLKQSERLEEKHTGNPWGNDGFS